MYKDQVPEVSTEAADLPQIRFPAKSVMYNTDNSADQVDIAKLSKLVKGAFAEIASSTGLSDQEVLRAIEDTDVELLEDVLKDGVNVDELREGIQEAIKKISLATALETAQISAIFIAKKNDNLEGIVSRLHYRGQANRDKFGNL